MGYTYVLQVKGNIQGGLVFHHVSAPETVVGAFGLERDDQKGIFELGRLVVDPSLNKTGITSFFLAHSMNLFRKKVDVRAIITYADSSKHVGTVYQACNFKYYGLTDQKYDMYIDGKIQERGAWKDADGNMKGEIKPRTRKHRYMQLNLH